MPAERLTMRKIREILRLRWNLKLSQRQVAHSCNVAPSTVAEVEYRAGAVGLTWPIDLDDVALEAKLYPPPQLVQARPAPDFAIVFRELKRPGVTLQLLWHEYRQAHTDDGYGYSRFCDLFRGWRRAGELTMRLQHKAGDKLFVDFAGHTLSLVDPHTGEVRVVQIFVAALAASNYTYAEACDSQSVPAWLTVHIHAFEFFGGVTAAIVPDNLKSGVTKPDFYDPDLNPGYRELARHYDSVILPARVRKPRDKAKVENAVQQVERWVLAPLRNHTFHSLAEMNAAIRERLDWLNNRPFAKLDGSRRSLFEQVEKPALKPLPAKRFEIAEWKVNVGVNIDYHIEFGHHFYSVPYLLVGERVDVRATTFAVEVLHKGRRVASHRRSFHKGGFSTLDEHRPKAHQRYAEWTPSRIVRWAETFGPNTAFVVEHVLKTKPHPEQGFRSCLGILRLGKRFGRDRLEAACARARGIGSLSYKSVASILTTGLDQKPMAPAVQQELPITHENIRGPDYFH